jgi:hypothetical protein
MCEVRPALIFEALQETTFALARDGKTDTKGMPNPLRLAVIAERHLAVVRRPFPPAAVQRIGLAVGAALGRARRYGPCYGTDAGTPAIIELGAASMAVA